MIAVPVGLAVLGLAAFLIFRNPPPKPGRSPRSQHPWRDFGLVVSILAGLSVLTLLLDALGS